MSLFFDLLQHPRRWALVLMTVFVAGATWTYLSRLPVSGVAAGALRESPREGFLAPDFTLESLDGRQVMLSTLRGKVVLINLWASWCPPCRAEMPAIDKVYQANRSRGFEVLAVDATNQDIESDARTFVQQLGLTFPVLLDRSGTVSQRYLLRAFHQFLYRPARRDPFDYHWRADVRSADKFEDQRLAERGAVMFPIVRIGPFVMRTPGLVYLAGFWIGSLLAEREARRLGLHAATVNTGIFLALIGGLLGARLVYVARYLNTYRANPAGILSLNPSALAVPEGIVIAVLAAWFYWWVRDMPFTRTLDAVTPLLSVLAIGIGVSHLASGSAYGAPARIPWAIYLWDDYRHPSQVYEIVAAVVVFGAVWGIRKSSFFPGFLFLLWTGLTAAARLFLESYRGDSTAVFGGLRTAQLAALGVLLLALWLMGKWAHTATAPAQAADLSAAPR